MAARPLDDPLDQFTSEAAPSPRRCNPDPGEDDGIWIGGDERGHHSIEDALPIVYERDAALARLSPLAPPFVGVSPHFLSRAQEDVRVGRERA